MRCFRSAPGALLILTATLAFSGCATLKQRALSAVPQDSLHLVWQAPPFADTTPAGARYHSIHFDEDYLLYRAQGMQAELVFLHSHGSAYSNVNLIRFGTTGLRRRAGTWAINQAPAPTWGTEDHIRTALADFAVRRYRLADGQRHCAAFEARWEFPATPQHWPRKALFGYVCAAPEQALHQPRLKALLAGLKVRYTADDMPAVLPLRKPDPVPAHDSQPAHGNASFPFLYSIYLPESPLLGATN